MITQAHVARAVNSNSVIKSANKNVAQINPIADHLQTGQHQSL